MGRYQSLKLFPQLKSEALPDQAFKAGIIAALRR